MGEDEARVDYDAMKGTQRRINSTLRRRQSFARAPGAEGDDVWRTFKTHKSPRLWLVGANKKRRRFSGTSDKWRRDKRRTEKF